MFRNCVPHPVLRDVMVCDEVPVAGGLVFDFGSCAHYVEPPRTLAQQNTIDGLGADLVSALL